MAGIGFGIVVFSLVVLLLVLAVGLLGFHKVPQGMAYTVERFGKYRRMLEAGPNFVNPFLDTVGQKVDMRERVLDVEPQEVITLDNAMVMVNGVAFFQVFDAAAAVYEVADYEQAVLNVIISNIRAAMGSMKLDELLSKRAEVAEAMLHDSDNATQPWGIKITNIRIKDINPPDDMVEAMARESKAEREKRAAILEAEGRKQAEIERALGAKEAVILQAEAEREAAILRAQGDHDTEIMEGEARLEIAEMDAKARVHLSEAEAKATMMVSQAISRGNVHAINYFIAEKYIDALGKLAGADNQKVILMPLEASSMIGSLGGIAELAKSAFNADPKKKTTNGSGDNKMLSDETQEHDSENPNSGELH